MSRWLRLDGDASPCSMRGSEQEGRSILSSLPAVCLFVGAVSGCRTPPASARPPPESKAACEDRQRGFLELLQGLPERALATAPSVEVPLSTVGGVPGNGPVVEISGSVMILDGEVVKEHEQASRSMRLTSWVSTWLSTRPAKPTIYVAAAPDLDIRSLASYLRAIPESVELKLLVRLAEPTPVSRVESSRPEGESPLARLLSERDPERREELSRALYQEYADCSALQQAVEASSQVSARERWQARRSALLQAVPSCACSRIDTQNLRSIVVAEQRAGAAGFATLPASFLRDPRCTASMPSRALGKLVKQVERFDEEFSGSFQKDAIAFEQVVDDDRLLNYFCNALPGETLAAQQRARATLYWRMPGEETCQAWRFEPLALGAPMGTWRRAGTSTQRELAFHYWQAAEEIKLFGPVPEGSDSKPTEAREWPCQENYRMTGVDARSISTENARWFLDEASCRNAPPSNASGAGCVRTLAAGAPE